MWDRMHPDREFDSQQAYRIGLAQRNLYKWLRPGEPAVQVDAACTFVLNHFYDGRRFDLGEVGRIKVDQRLGRSSSQILTEHQKNILDFVRNRGENDEGATPAEIFEALGREHRILSDRDVDALINYGYLARRADRRIIPIDLFEGQSDDEQTLRVEAQDGANAGTLLSLIGTPEDGAHTVVRVQQQVTETLGEPVAVATQPIYGGSTSDDAITHGEVAIMKNRFLAGDSIVEAGQLIYAERVSQGPVPVVAAHAGSRSGFAHRRCGNRGELRRQRQHAQSAVQPAGHRAGRTARAGPDGHH